MSRTALWVGLLLGWTGTAAHAQEPATADEQPVVPVQGIFHRHKSNVAPLCPPVVPGYPVYPETPGMPPTVSPDLTMPPSTIPPDLSGLTTPFATQTGAGGLQGRAFNESFDGDFGGIFYRKTIIVGSHSETRRTGTRTTVTFRPNPNPEGQPIRVVTRTPIFSTFTITDTRQVLVPVPGRYSGISITDNDSPKPTDRLYFNYGYYDGLNAQLAPGIGNITMNRPVIGFEKTFLGGDASIGMRLPFVQIGGPPGAAANSVGDLSVLSKYAFINNPNGDVLSAGLVLTTPTAADGGVFFNGTDLPHSVLFQPWVGFVSVFDRLYFQGISAVIVPTDSRDITLWGNSLGMGYWLYRSTSDRFIRGIIPVMEVHVRTPLNHRDVNGLVFLQDMVNVTGGLHIRLPRATIGGAVCVPTVSPRPWNVEAVANVSFWF